MAALPLSLSLSPKSCSWRRAVRIWYTSVTVSIGKLLFWKLQATYGNKVLYRLLVCGYILPAFWKVRLQESKHGISPSSLGRTSVNGLCCSCVCRGILCVIQSLAAPSVVKGCPIKRANVQTVGVHWLSQGMKRSYLICCVFQWMTG